MSIDIEQYYLRYGPMVLRRCRFLLNDEEKALDAMQDVFARLLSYRNRLRDEFPSSLLYRMATNVCLNKIRNEKKDVIIVDDSIIVALAHNNDHVEQIANADMLDYIFSNELASTREMAVLHYLDGYTLEEVAAETGFSVSGVRKRLRNLTQNAREKGMGLFNGL